MNDLETIKNQKSKDLRNNIIVITLSVILVAVVVLFFIQRKDHSVILNEIKRILKPNGRLSVVSLSKENGNSQYSMYKKEYVHFRYILKKP